MRRTLILIGGTALMILALLVPASSASAATTAVARRTTTFSFALVTPNTAVAPDGGMMASPGDWIAVTGGGTFDPVAATVRAGGAFVHHNADGTVVCRGVWRATALTGWTEFGTTRGRTRAGVLTMLVVHHCAMGDTHRGITMTVTSTRTATPGSTYVEGITVAEFTQSRAGAVVIRAHDSRR